MDPDAGHTKRGDLVGDGLSARKAELAERQQQPVELAAAKRNRAAPDRVFRPGGGGRAHQEAVRHAAARDAPGPSPFSFLSAIPPSARVSCVGGEAAPASTRSP